MWWIEIKTAETPWHDIITESELENKLWEHILVTPATSVTSESFDYPKTAYMGYQTNNVIEISFIMHHNGVLNGTTKYHLDTDTFSDTSYKIYQE